MAVVLVTSVLLPFPLMSLEEQATLTAHEQVHTGFWLASLSFHLIGQQKGMRWHASDRWLFSDGDSSCVPAYVSRSL